MGRAPDAGEHQGRHPAIRDRAGVLLGAGDGGSEPEVLTGTNRAEKKGDTEDSRSSVSRGRETWVPSALPGTPWQPGQLEHKERVEVMTGSEAGEVAAGSRPAKLEGGEGEL